MLIFFRIYLNNDQLGSNRTRRGANGPYKTNNGRSSSLFFQNLWNEPTVVVDRGGTTERFSTGYDEFCAQVLSGKMCLNDMHHTRLASNVSRSGVVLVHLTESWRLEYKTWKRMVIQDVSVMAPSSSQKRGPRGGKNQAEQRYKDHGSADCYGLLIAIAVSNACRMRSPS